MSNSPRFTWTSRPSIVTVTTSGPGRTGITYSWSDGHCDIGTAVTIALLLLRYSCSRLDGDRVATLGVARHALDDLVAPEPVQAHDRRHRARPELADRGHAGWPPETGREVVPESQHEVEILGAAMPVEHAVQHLLEPPRSLAARCALAARLVREELRDAPRDEQRVDGLV